MSRVGRSRHCWGHGSSGPLLLLLAEGVEDGPGSVWSNAVGEALSSQGPETDELDLGLGNVVHQDQW